MIDTEQTALWPELAPEPRRCETCGRLLPDHARADARYCTDRSTCRTSAHRHR